MRTARGTSDGSRLFPRVRGRDIDVLKRFAMTKGLGMISWHGLRRGRTVDLLERGGTNGVNISLAELFQSGGWTYGSRAILSYIPEQAAHKERVFRLSADASDTEVEGA